MTPRIEREVMPPLEQEIAANNQAPDAELTVQAGESAVTAPQDAQSPDTPQAVAGEQPTEPTPEAAAEDPAPATESQPVEAEAEVKADESPKARTAKRFQDLLTEKKQKDEEISQLKAKLAAQLQPKAGQTQRPIEQTSGYWANEYNKLDESDPRREQLYVQYQRCRDAETEEALLGKVQQMEQTRHFASVVAGQYAEIHRDYPIFKADGSFDPQSAAVQRANALAAADGIAANDHPTALLYLQRAVRELDRETAVKATDKTRQLAKQTRTIQAQTGLEPAKRHAAPPTPTKDATKRDLEQRAARGDRSAARQLFELTYARA